MNYKAYIFDYDYTLAFSETAILMCFHHMFDAFGMKKMPDDDIVKTIGLPLKDAISKLSGITAEEKLEDMRKAFHNKADEVMNAYTEFYPDTVPMLKTIRKQGGLIGIVSNKMRKRIEDMFKMHGLSDYIDLIIGSEDIAVGKPDPEGLLLAMKKLNVEKEETLYIGDNIIDALTAKNADVPFVGVTAGTTTKRAFSNEPNMKIIKNLSELFD